MTIDNTGPIEYHRHNGDWYFQNNISKNQKDHNTPLIGETIYAGSSTTNRTLDR